VGTKSIVAVDATDLKFRGCVAPGRWTLCLGAGLSRGVAPTWFDLTMDIVNATFGSRHDRTAFEKLVANSGWSLDAWIQAAANEFVVSGRTLDEFNDLLESLLYGQLRKDALGLPIAKHLIQVLNNPIRAEKNRILEVCEFFEGTYKESSLLGIVRFLIAAAKAGRKPHAIITFNADTFLEMACTRFRRHRVRCFDGTGGGSWRDGSLRGSSSLRPCG
jgi:hypothetical protein